MTHRGRAALYAALGLLSLIDLWVWLHSVAASPHATDFRAIYGATRVGLANGWASMYDLGLLRSSIGDLGPGTNLVVFIFPPPMAWLAAPIAWLPFPAADFLWSLILVGALVATWWLAAPGSGRPRLIHLLVVSALWPVAFCLFYGQPTPLVMLGIAAAAWLLDRDSDFAAGLALGVTLLKPNIAFLVPFALLACGRRRAFAGWAVAWLVLGVMSFAAIGIEGVMRAINLASIYAEIPRHHRPFTVPGLLGTGLAGRAVEVAAGGLALWIAWWQRARGHHMAIGVGMLGTLLATFHFNTYDFALAPLAGWMLWRGFGRPLLPWLLAGWVVIELVIGVDYPIPIFAGLLLVWLAILPRLTTSEPASPTAPASVRVTT